MGLANCRTDSAAARTLSRLAISISMMVGLVPPAPTISLAKASPFSRFLQRKVNSAPSRAKLNALARPIPAVGPVMTMCLARLSMVI